MNFAHSLITGWIVAGCLTNIAAADPASIGAVDKVQNQAVAVQRGARLGGRGTDILSR